MYHLSQFEDPLLHPFRLSEIQVIKRLRDAKLGVHFCKRPERLK
ncbi:MAG TPA: hypothetical protein VGA32_06345 [Anaerolineales bacterium]